MDIKIVALSAFSVSFEFDEMINGEVHPFYSKNKYNVYLNDTLVLENVKENVVSIYDLTPDTEYKLTIKQNGKEVCASFKTEIASVIKTITYSYKKDYTVDFQEALDTVGENGCVVVEKGIYDIRPLFLRDGVTLYLKKGAHLLASTNRWDYPLFDELLDELPLGTWEGRLSKMFASVITGIRIKNAKVIGEGIIDGNAQNSDWWINHKVLRGGARPRDVYLNYCDNILLQGVTVQNTACWTLHPYYSDNVKFINLKVYNPNTSPNTDGCDPESVRNLDILGCIFSVGDDCIAIKSGKIEMMDKYYRTSENITIRNCLMRDGHGAIVLGSEISSGLKGLNVEKCLFINTDRGLRIKTRRGRGDLCVIDNVLFKDIIMHEVLNPFVINMYYFCDADGKSEYVQCKTALPVDKNTPYLGKFKFQNIKCIDTTVSAGFFYGLPEQPIEQIEFENVLVDMKDSDIYFHPAMMCDIDMVNRIGSVFNNVNKVILNNLNIYNQKGEMFVFNNVNEIIKK